MKLISSILFLIIAILVFFFAVNPLRADVSQLRTNVATYNTALDSSTDLQRTRDNLVNTYKGIKKEDKDRLTHFLPDSVDNIQLILEIEKIANLHGMPLKDIKFEIKNATEKNTENENLVIQEDDPMSYLPYNIFPMEFVIEGKYGTFLKFLEDLEDNLRLVDVMDISFDVPDLANQSNTFDTNYSYTLKIQTYWLK